MIRLVGANAYFLKSSLRKDPAQLSKSLTTSAPAKICWERYSIVASVIRSIKASKTGRSVDFKRWAGA